MIYCPKIWIKLILKYKKWTMWLKIRFYVLHVETTQVLSEYGPFTTKTVWVFHAIKLPLYGNSLKGGS